MTGHPIVVEKTSPTVTPANPFNASEDAQALLNAVKGLGTDEATIINILAHRSITQRTEIALTYKTMFGRDLVEDLRNDTSGNFREVIVALMTPLPTYFAMELKRALSGFGTDKEAIIEILSTLSNYGIKTVSFCYKKMYNTDLEKDIEHATYCNFKRLCVSLCQGNRCEEPFVDVEKARSDAKALYEAGEKRWGTDESVFNAILVKNNFRQLKQVFTEYEALTGHGIEKAINAEFSGSIRKGNLAIVKCVHSKVGFLAERLYYSMKGLGTDDKTLIRIIVSRSEIDLGDIKRVFEEKYEDTLQNFVADDTSGNYRKLLIELIP